SAYREGDEGRQVGQGSCPAALADPLVQRQDVCRETGDGEPWTQNSGSRWGNLGTPGTQDEGRTPTAATWLSTQTAAASVHRETRHDGHAPLGYPHDEGPRHAGPSPAGAQPSRGDHKGRKLLRLPSGEVRRRRHDEVLHDPRQE